MYNILSRTTSNLGHLSRSPLAPLPLKGNASSNFLGQPRDSIDAGVKHHFLSHNNLLATNASSNHVTPPDKIVVLDQSSTHNRTLLDINERLTRQIEDNLSLFENLNKELNSKDEALVQGEAKISEKDKELRKLKQQLKHMDESMKRLMQVTKLTSEATEASKARHLEEMDKIKRRQEEYQEKISRI